MYQLFINERKSTCSVNVLDEASVLLYKMSVCLDEGFRISIDGKIYVSIFVGIDKALLCISSIMVCAIDVKLVSKEVNCKYMYKFSI